MAWGASVAGVGMIVPAPGMRHRATARRGVGGFLRSRERSRGWREVAGIAGDALGYTCSAHMPVDAPVRDLAQRQRLPC